MYAPNANMVTSSFDRIQGSLVNVTTQPYNNFRITNSGGNIIQGQMNKISVTEIMFPYNTPTVTAPENGFLYFVVYDISPEGVVTELITGGSGVNVGWYDGSGMVATLNNNPVVPGGDPVSDYLEFTWDPVTQTISVTVTPVWDEETGGYAIQLYPIGGEDIGSAIYNQFFSYPNLLWTLGFRNFLANYPITAIPAPPILFNLPALVSIDTPPEIIAALGIPTFERIVGSQYSGRYTDYVDIVSTSLSQAQYIRDSSTSQATPKRDIIARIYICTNVSTYTADAAGSRPFTIYRNFTNPKVIKWTADRSIDAIDLQLFDMYGQPLPNAVFGFPSQTDLAVDTWFDCGPSNYAITFHVHEPGTEIQNENVGYRF